MVVIRLLIDREKFEQAQFKWPQEHWDEGNRMILPRGRNDAEYRDRLKHLALAMDEVERILANPEVHSIEDFKAILNKYVEPLTLSQCLSRFCLSKHGNRQSTIRTYTATMKRVIDVLGDMEAAKVSRGDLEKIEATYRNAGRNAYTLHQTLNLVLRLAEEADIIEANPYKKFKTAFSGASQGGKRLDMKDSFVDKIWQAWEASPEGKERRAMALFLLQCFSGARYSDACLISMQDIERGFYISVKTGKSCPLVQSERVLAIAGQGLPIRMGYSSYRHTLIRVCESVGVASLRSHDGRRYFASALNSETGDIMVVKQALGHSTVAMTERYVTPNNEKMIAGISKIGKM
jgi:integrase